MEGTYSYCEKCFVLLGDHSVKPLLRNPNIGTSTSWSSRERRNIGDKADVDYNALRLQDLGINIVLMTSVRSKDNITISLQG